MADGYLLKADGGRILKSDGGGILIHLAPEVVVVFPVLPPTLESVLAGAHVPVARVLFLGPDLETVRYAVDAAFDPETGWLMSGSVTMERGRDTHRSGTVNLVDRDGLFRAETPESLVWPNAPVAIERGAMVGSSPQYVRLITGIIDSPSDGSFSGGVSFSVESRLHLANRNFFEPVTFEAGVRVREVIRTICELAGIGTEDARYALSTGGQALAQPRSYDITDNMLTSMVRLAFDHGCELYDTGMGVITLRPFVDPSTVEPLWDLGTTQVTLQRKRTLRALPGIYNRVRVKGYSPDTYPIVVEAKVTNEADPLYWRPDFDFPMRYESPDIGTTQAALAVANRLLIEGALGEESVGTEAIPIPLLLENGRPVAAYNGDRQLLDRVTMPITLGSMSLDATRVRSLVS